ncbi:NAD-dependent epimerase/dehydratase family protein [bacterium]|nr:NAD-dependent epimerase/dehydratase family protein [bacterium]
MRVLVTGAPGWLGTTLVERLALGKRDIRCFTMRGSNTTELQGFGVKDIIFGDVRNASSLKGAANDVHTVVHCAGIIHPKKANEFHEINTQGTRNVLAEALESGVKKFIHISSNAAQGFNKDRDTLMTETGPCRPESPYGRSKRAAEISVMEAHGKNGMQCVILRPCMYFGPRMSGRMVKLINMVKGGRPPIFGDGHHLRSLTNVESLVDAILLAEKKDEANGELSWISDKEPYSTLLIYQALADILGVALTPLFIPAILGNLCEHIDVAINNFGIYSENFHIVGETVRNVGCDPQKSIDILGMEPNYGIKRGYMEAIEWAIKMGMLPSSVISSG